MYGVDVVIHHLDAPRYVIKNNVEKDCDTLMLSYHDGEHYNSVKNIRDIDSGKQVCKCKILKQNKISDNNQSENGGDIDKDGEWEMSAAEKRKQKRMERRVRKHKKEKEKLYRRHNQYNSNTKCIDNNQIDKLSSDISAIVL